MNLYKNHKKYILFIFITSIFSYILLTPELLSLTSEIISINAIFLTVYTLSLGGLISNAHLCKSLFNEQDNEIKTKSKLGIIISYYKIGYSTCLISVLLIYIGKLIEFNINLIMNYIVILVSFISFCLLNINFIITIYILKFIFNFQTRRFN